MRTVTRVRPLLVLADDDPDVRELLTEGFEEHGFDVMAATDGADMISLLERLPAPDLIFVDLMMPGLIGNAVLDFVRSEPRLAHVPVAIVSGSPELAPAGYTLFTKPVHMTTLVQYAHRALQLSHASPGH